MINDTTVTTLKSLADPTRLSIVRKLARDGCEQASNDIITTCAASLNLSQPTMSHHFARLVYAGVLNERKRGTEKHYTLNVDELSRIGIDVHKL